jgi:hypothetical protein
MTALSVSISAIVSPFLIGSPSFITHFTKRPLFIVSDNVGIVIGSLMTQATFSALWRDLPLASRLEVARLGPPQPRRPSVQVRSLTAQFWAQREQPALPRRRLDQDSLV